MSVLGHEHKLMTPALRVVPLYRGGALQGEVAFTPDTPAISDYLKDFEDAAEYNDPDTCAEVYNCLKEVYVPKDTIEVVDIFTGSRYSLARMAAAVLTKQWLVGEYSKTTWPKIAPAFEALLHDENEGVASKAYEARRAFIANASSSLEAQRRIVAVRRLRMPHFSTTKGIAQ